MTASHARSQLRHRPDEITHRLYRNDLRMVNASGSAHVHYVRATAKLLVRSSTVQFAISDLGFEMQDSSDFEILILGGGTTPPHFARLPS